MTENIYSKWASFFKSMCGKFGLKPHIDGFLPPQPDNPMWDPADCSAHSWVYGFVNNFVLDLAMDTDKQTARDLWLAIECLFRANKPSQAIFLSYNFHYITQGNDSITVYTGRMKKVPDDLRHIDHPVQDSQLVLNLLRGLNPRFSTTSDDIANSATDFPSFSDACDLLVMKKLRLASEAKVAFTTTLLAATSSCASSCTSSGGCRSAAAGADQSDGYSHRPTGDQKKFGGGNKWNKKGKPIGGPQQPQSNDQPRPAEPWFCFNPYAVQGFGFRVLGFRTYHPRDS
ncbi:unnamed protein product [Urochloa humidicola]